MPINRQETKKTNPTIVEALSLSKVLLNIPNKIMLQKMHEQTITSHASNLLLDFISFQFSIFIHFIIYFYDKSLNLFPIRRTNCITNYNINVFWLKNQSNLIIVESFFLFWYFYVRNYNFDFGVWLSWKEIMLWPENELFHPVLSNHVILWIVFLRNRVIWIILTDILTEKNLPNYAIVCKKVLHLHRVLNKKKTMSRFYFTYSYFYFYFWKQVRQDFVCSLLKWIELIRK